MTEPTRQQLLEAIDDLSGCIDVAGFNDLQPETREISAWAHDQVAHQQEDTTT